MKIKKTNSAPVFIIDSSALKIMFEGKNKGKSNTLLKKLKEMNDLGQSLIAITTMSSFLRAIHLCDPKSNIQKMQKVLSFLRISPSFADFKNEKGVRDEIIRFATIMIGGGNDNKKD